MDRRIQKTKAAILEAYMEMASAKKSSKVSISEIAKIANIDRKTFYAHYESVDDIMKEFWLSRVEELLSKLKMTNYFKEPLKLDIVFVELNRILERDMAFYQLLATNVNFSYFWSHIHEIVVKAVLDAYGDQAALPKSEVKVYCDFFVSGIIQLYQTYLKNPDSLPANEMGRILVDIAQNGLTGLIPDK